MGCGASLFPNLACNLVCLYRNVLSKCPWALTGKKQSTVGTYIEKLLVCIMYIHMNHTTMIVINGWWVLTWDSMVPRLPKVPGKAKHHTIMFNQLVCMCAIESLSPHYLQSFHHVNFRDVVQSRDQSCHVPAIVYYTCPAIVCLYTVETADFMRET